MSLKEGLQCACNSLFASVEMVFPVTGFCVDILKAEPSSQLIGLFTTDGVHSILEEKGRQCIHVFVPSTCAYVDKATGFIEDAKLKRANTI